jgi:hypothetical protein
MRRVSDRVGGADAVSRAPGSALDPVPVVNKCPGNSDGSEPFRLSDEAPPRTVPLRDAATGSL